MRLTITNALIATFITAILMFLLRAFPFMLFSKKKPPKILSFIEKYIPAMVIGVLLLVCLNDEKYISTSSFPWGIPALCGIVLTVILHLWKKNSMISIFGGTICYMVLNNIMV